MKRWIYFLSYVDDILVFGRCIQKNLLIFTFMNKHFFKSLWQKEAQGEIASYEQYKFH